MIETMEDAEYSKLEAHASVEREFEYTRTTRRRRLFGSLWFIAIVAFCAGIFATIGLDKLYSSMTISPTKRETDWLSKFSAMTNSRVMKLIILEPDGNFKVQLAYNDTFPGPPTMKSEHAWLDLLPSTYS